MTTERELLLLALDKRIELQKKAMEELIREKDGLRHQLRQAHRATTPADRLSDGYNEASTLKPQGIAQQERHGNGARITWFKPDGPQPGDGSLCPCGCGYVAGVA